MVVANSKAFAPLTTPHFSSESILNQISVSSCKSLLLGKKRNYNCKQVQNNKVVVVVVVVVDDDK